MRKIGPYLIPIAMIMACILTIELLRGNEFLHEHPFLYFMIYVVIGIMHVTGLFLEDKKPLIDMRFEESMSFPLVSCEKELVYTQTIPTVFTKNIPKTKYTIEWVENGITKKGILYIEEPTDVPSGIAFRTYGRKNKTFGRERAGNWVNPIFTYEEVK